VAPNVHVHGWRKDEGVTISERVRVSPNGMVGEPPWSCRRSSNTAVPQVHRILCDRIEEDRCLKLHR